MYKSLAAMSTGIFVALVASAALENRNSTTLSGSVGAGEWYETSYIDITLVAVFGILTALTRRRSRGSEFLHVMFMAAFAASIAVIVSKWISNWRFNTATTPPTDPESLAFRNNRLRAVY